MIQRRHGVGEQPVCVGWCPVVREVGGFPGSFGDQLIEVVGLGGGELADGEVVQDQDGGAGELGEPLAPGAVGVAAGQMGRARLVLRNGPPPVS